MADYLDVLIESHNPSLLMRALRQYVLTGRAVLSGWIHIHLRAGTAIPWGAHAVGAFFLAGYHCTHEPTTGPSACPMIYSLINP
jgi:hypothetical protein